MQFMSRNMHALSLKKNLFRIFLRFFSCSAKEYSIHTDYQVHETREREKGSETKRDLRIVEERGRSDEGINRWRNGI